MYCTKCGIKNSADAKFCTKCGETILLKDRSKLRVTYNRTGNVSMFFGIMGFVVAMIVGFKSERVVTDAVVALMWNFPRLYFGYKLKYYGVSDLKYAIKVSGGMLIYSLAFVVLDMVVDGSGFLYIIPAFFYYISYKETKMVL